MSTHNTHYATKLDKVIPSSGLTFFSIYYDSPVEKWLIRNRRLSSHPSSAARFSSFEYAKTFASIDFLCGSCDIVVFNWSTTSSCYFSSHGYTCLGGRTEWYAGRFEI